MTITILEALYIVLIVFISIVGTLLVLALLKVNRILTVVDEITGYYTKVKKIIEGYSHIPDNVKEAVKAKIKKQK